MPVEYSVLAGRVVRMIEVAVSVPGGKEVVAVRRKVLTTVDLYAVSQYELSLKGFMVLRR